MTRDEQARKLGEIQALMGGRRWERWGTLIKIYGRDVDEGRDVSGFPLLGHVLLMAQELLAEQFLDTDDQDIKDKLSYALESLDAAQCYASEAEDLNEEERE